MVNFRACITIVNLILLLVKSKKDKGLDTDFFFQESSSEELTEKIFDKVSEVLNEKSKR